jgi:hypothetical protein
MGEDIKRYFIEKCCERGKKPTGSSGPARSIAEAQKIYAKILEKNAQSTYGGAAGSDSDSDSDSEEEGGDPDAVFVGALGPPGGALGPPGSTAAAPPLARQDTLGDTVPVAGADTVPAVSAVPKRKRHAEDQGAGSKTKNSRPTNPRSSTQGAINSLVTTLAARHTPAAPDASAQMMQQMQMQVMMMMMMMMMMQHFSPQPTTF